MKSTMVKAMLSNQGLFGITFIKKNGEVRKLHGRLGVKKGLTGKGMAYNPTKKNLMVVWDMQKHAYRMVNCDTITEIRTNGQTLKVQ